jgi:shikimate kinase
LNKCSENTVFVLSSGFLVHKGLDDLVTRHVKTLSSTGVSILLMPSTDIEETVEVVIKRQIKRGFGLIEEHERRKIKERFPKYLKFGDIKIFSHDKPKIIAEEMFNKLANR